MTFLTPSFLTGSFFFIIASKKDNHKISDEIEIRPGPTTDCELAALKRLENAHRLTIRAMSCPL